MQVCFPTLNYEKGPRMASGAGGKVQEGGGVGEYP